MSASNIWLKMNRITQHNELKFYIKSDQYLKACSESEEIIRWVLLNSPSGHIAEDAVHSEIDSYGDSFMGFWVLFDDPQDAILFKLRWECS